MFCGSSSVKWSHLLASFASLEQTDGQNAEERDRDRTEMGNKVRRKLYTPVIPEVPRHSE